MKFEVLYPGAEGPMTELLQLGLRRAGLPSGDPAGFFGRHTAASLREFQIARGLRQDEAVARETWCALLPYLTGYMVYTAQPGDTLFRLAVRHRTSVRAVITANPACSFDVLQPGERVIVPLGFEVVPTDLRFTSALCELCVRGLVARYPFLETYPAGSALWGAGCMCLRWGRGSARSSLMPRTTRTNGLHRCCS